MAKKFIKISILALAEEQKVRDPAIILIDKKANRILPISIGETEAKAIAEVMQKLKIDRPTPHRLMESIIKKLGGKIEKIIINKIETNTFYSIIFVKVRGSEKPIQIDARPSDAITLALQAKATVFVDSKIMDALAQDNPFQIGAKIKFTKKEINYMAALLKIAREKEEGTDI
ncbi:MAG: bifunctional nuclease family protein [Candidatus Gracilibacteria bacterium]